MKKIIILFVIIFSNVSLYSQSQFGIILETNSANIKSSDLYGVENGGLGYGFGISALSPFWWQTADFLIEMKYNTKKVKIAGYYDYYNQKTELSDSEFNISDINVDLVLNQYIIMPEGNNLHIGVQGGFGIPLLNAWSTKNQKEDNFFGDGRFINLNYIVGVSGGTEQLRATIRYNSNISNIFKDFGVVEPDPTNSHSNLDSRLFNGKLSYISLSVTYYFDNFK